ncbi:MAG: Rnase Y domain-containing protein, partial [Patescibacteria group bacterium]
MTLKVVLLIASSAGVAGIAIGYFLRLIISLGKKGSMELEIKQMMLEAKEDAKKITTEAEKKAEETMLETRKEIKEKEEKTKQTEDRLIKKEDLLDKRQVDIDAEVENIKTKIVEIKKIRDHADKLELEKKEALEKITQLTEDEAKQELFSVIEQKFEGDILSRIRKIETSGTERLEKKARDILSTSIQRLANSVASDIMSTSVAIPNDEIKGKIIGKEGRNIKAFERITGVEVIVDDTPGAITISSFDPVRRQIAKIALEELIKDGRIQPAKIEKIVEKAQQD